MTKDFFAATEGSGENLVVDKISTDNYQVVKIAKGAYGTADLPDIGDGFPVDAGDNFVVQVAPTVTAGAYTADDCIGGEMTIANAARVSGGGGTLIGITMASKADVAAYDVEVLIFDGNPAGTYTDNTALAVTAADAFLLLDAVLLDKKTDLGTPSMLTARNLNIPYVCDGSTSLFAVAVNRTAFTPGSTSDLQFTFHLIRD